MVHNKLKDTEARYNFAPIMQPKWQKMGHTVCPLKNESTKLP